MENLGANDLVVKSTPYAFAIHYSTLVLSLRDRLRNNGYRYYSGKQ